MTVRLPVDVCPPPLSWTVLYGRKGVGGGETESVHEVHGTSVPTRKPQETIIIAIKNGAGDVLSPCPHKPYLGGILHAMQQDRQHQKKTTQPDGEPTHQDQPPPYQRATTTVRKKRAGTGLVGAPGLGSAEGGHPDLFRFVPISPFSSDLFRFALLVFGNTPICSDLFRFAPFSSDLFRFVFRTNQGNPFLPNPFANPRA